MPRHKDPALDVQCSLCGGTYHTTTQRIRMRTKHSFCSRECFYAYRKANPELFPSPPKKKAKPENRIERECLWCEKKLILLPWRVNRRSGRVFCGQECFAKWKSENLSGENSPGWKGGHSMDYGGSGWKSARAKVRKRDNHTCQDCGAKEQAHGYKMDVHHIIPYDTFDDPREANNLVNLVTLCRVCHVKRHKEGVTITYPERE